MFSSCTRKAKLDLTRGTWLEAEHHVGGGHGGGHQGGGGGERSGGQVQHDPALLQGGLHEGLQEDHRGGLPGKTDYVRCSHVHSGWAGLQCLLVLYFMVFFQRFLR